MRFNREAAIKAGFPPNEVDRFLAENGYDKSGVKQEDKKIEQKPASNYRTTPSPTQAPKQEGNMLDGFHNSTPDKYKPMIAKAAQEKGVPTSILSSLLSHESMGYNEDVIYGRLDSPVGAQGIGQFMPTTSAGMGFDPLKPEEAIPAAAGYLKSKKDRHGSWELGLAGYNAGSGNVEKYGGIPPFKETENYVKNIMGDHTKIRSMPQATPTPIPKQPRQVFAKPTVAPTTQPIPKASATLPASNIARNSPSSSQYHSGIVNPNTYVYNGTLTPEEMEGVERGYQSKAEDFNPLGFMGGGGVFAAEREAPKKKRTFQY